MPFTHLHGTNALGTEPKNIIGGSPNSKHFSFPTFPNPTAQGWSAPDTFNSAASLTVVLPVAAAPAAAAAAAAKKEDSEQSKEDSEQSSVVGTDTVIPSFEPTSAETNMAAGPTAAAAAASVAAAAAAGLALAGAHIRTKVERGSLKKLFENVSLPSVGPSAPFRGMVTSLSKKTSFNLNEMIDDKTILMETVENGHIDNLILLTIQKYLPPLSEGTTDIRATIAQRKTLLDKVDFAAKNSRGKTALHYAIEACNGGSGTSALNDRHEKLELMLLVMHRCIPNNIKERQELIDSMMKNNDLHLILAKAAAGSKEFKEILRIAAETNPAIHKILQLSITAVPNEKFSNTGDFLIPKKCNVVKKKQSEQKKSGKKESGKKKSGKKRSGKKSQASAQKNSTELNGPAFAAEASTLSAAAKAASAAAAAAAIHAKTTAAATASAAAAAAAASSAAPTANAVAESIKRATERETNNAISAIHNQPRLERLERLERSVSGEAADLLTQLIPEAAAGAGAGAGAAAVPATGSVNDILPTSTQVIGTVDQNSAPRFLPSFNNFSRVPTAEEQRKLFNDDLDKPPEEILKKALANEVALLANESAKKIDEFYRKQLEKVLQAGGGTTNSDTLWALIEQTKRKRKFVASAGSYPSLLLAYQEEQHSGNLMANFNVSAAAIAARFAKTEKPTVSSSHRTNGILGSAAAAAAAAAAASAAVAASASRSAASAAAVAGAGAGGGAGAGAGAGGTTGAGVGLGGSAAAKVASQEIALPPLKKLKPSN